MTDLPIGFDTASSIALLAVSALAKRDADGKGISAASIVILPVYPRLPALRVQLILCSFSSRLE